MNRPSRGRIRFGQRVSYLAVRALFAVVAFAPQCLAYPFAGSLGRLFFWVVRSRRALAMRFLRQAFGSGPSERELARIGARATANIFKVAVDTVRLPKLAQQGRLFECVDISAWRGHLPEPPFLAVGAHLGCWEGAAMSMAALGYDVHAVGKSARNPLLDGWIVEMRRRAGIHIHPRRGGIRILSRALANGGVGAMVIDQNQRLRPVVAPFFGAPARCERSAAKLALRRGCPVVVGAVVRVGYGLRFRALLSEPLTFVRTGDRDHDLVVATTRLNAEMEKLILQVPDQYLWIHDRYRGARAEGT